jgi:hypothetical protein
LGGVVVWVVVWYTVDNNSRGNIPLIFLIKAREEALIPMRVVKAVFNFELKLKIRGKSRTSSRITQKIVRELLSINKPMTKKKAFRVGLISLGVLILIFIIYVAVINWMIETGRIVKWDNRWYTQGQLEEKYPPQYHEAEAQNTPEEVYAGFRQAILQEDVEVALTRVKLDKREEFRELFDDKELLTEYQNLPPQEEIKENEILGNFASYTYRMVDQRDKKTPYFIEFEKNPDGYWMISSI